MCRQIRMTHIEHSAPLPEWGDHMPQAITSHKLVRWSFACGLLSTHLWFQFTTRAMPLWPMQTEPLVYDGREGSSAVDDRLLLYGLPTSTLAKKVVEWHWSHVASAFFLLRAQLSMEEGRGAPASMGEKAGYADACAVRIRVRACASDMMAC